MRDEQSTGSSEIAALAQRVETARGKLPLQHDAALFDVLSEDEIVAERELAEWVRAQRRKQRKRAVEAELAAEKRDRRTAAHIRRSDEDDARWHRRALAARRRVSSQDARLAQLYRRAEWSSRALIAVVVLGMVWAGVNVQHNLVPSGDMSDPLYWLSYGIEAMISIPIITIMVAATTAARWGRELARGKVVFFETALLGTTIALNAGPHLASGSYGQAAEYAIAPVMVGVVIWLHAWVSARYALLIDGAAVVDPEPGMVRRQVERGFPLDAPDDLAWLPTREAHSGQLNSGRTPDDRATFPSADGDQLRYSPAAAGQATDTRAAVSGLRSPATERHAAPDQMRGRAAAATDSVVNGRAAQGLTGVNGHELVHAAGSATPLTNGHSLRATNGHVLPVVDEQVSHAYGPAGPVTNGRAVQGLSSSAPTNGNAVQGLSSADGHLVPPSTESATTVGDGRTVHGTDQPVDHPATAPGEEREHASLDDDGQPRRFAFEATSEHERTTRDTLPDGASGSPAIAAPTARVTNGHVVRGLSSGNGQPLSTSAERAGSATNGHASPGTNGHRLDHVFGPHGAAVNGSAEQAVPDDRQAAPAFPTQDHARTTSADHPDAIPAAEPNASGAPEINGYDVPRTPEPNQHTTDGHAVAPIDGYTRPAETRPVQATRPINGAGAQPVSAEQHGTVQQPRINGHAVTNGHAVNGRTGTANGRPLTNGEEAARTNGHNGTNGHAIPLFPMHEVAREQTGPGTAVPPMNEPSTEAPRGDDPEEPHPGDPIRKAAATIADTVAQAISGEPAPKPAGRRKSAAPNGARAEAEIEQLVFEEPAEPPRPRARVEPSSIVSRDPIEPEPEMFDDEDEDEFDEDNEIAVIAHEIVRRRMSNLPAAQLAEILRLADEAWATPGIANEVGVSRAAVDRAVEAAMKVRRPYAISG
ncbi:hypothetical protein [Nocardia brasiliensis]|uniref:Uncharacterized protein n=1 Tax=Nocardia brasiliensis (strain ATCC 700358 / HUJEG-1) TaxID=1133849 RepID=K0EPS3_NOCB7|nr:hypothetical protein [Nocardia brasiliensis]AFT98814.1 hypothetical protein O3I_004260 [Nocardia brasiliensis ATCC 700358]OCF89078.1 hypothetical protein AW168_19195 [Nocardia brasiliensis]